MNKVPKTTTRRAKELARLVVHHQKLYHEKDAPDISDEAYDSLMTELSDILNKYPLLSKKYLQVEAVGGRPDGAFEKVTHKVRQWSYDKVFSDEEVKRLNFLF